MINKNGFTLIELLIVVAIIGIVSAIAMPVYIGYIDEARATTAKNNLRSIYMQEHDYYTNNNVYYSSGASCSDHTSNINTTLFSGSQIVDNTYYIFCITQTSTDNFTARAQNSSDSNEYYTIDQDNNTVNF